MEEATYEGSSATGGCLFWALLCWVSGVSLGTAVGGGFALLGLLSLSQADDATPEDVAWLLAVSVAIGLLLS